jgi:YfiH family protein
MLLAPVPARGTTKQRLHQVESRLRRGDKSFVAKCLRGERFRPVAAVPRRPQRTETGVSALAESVVRPSTEGDPSPRTHGEVESGFQVAATAAGRVLRSTGLAPFAEHLFTSRDLQFREGSLRLDYARIASAFSVEAGAVLSVRQVHGRAVAVVRPGTRLPEQIEADAIVSLDPDCVVSVRVADCVPILIADRHRRAVAAVHAGWRGTAAGVVRAAVEALGAIGVAPADLVAAIGPCAGPCCYQVDASVREQFEEPAADAWFVGDGAGHWKLDLPGANRDQLRAAGVTADAVSSAGECTIHRVEHWFSHRREGAAAGRMVAAIRVSGMRAGGDRP